MTTNVKFHLYAVACESCQIPGHKDEGIWEGTSAITPSSNSATHRSYTAFYDMCEQRIYAVLDWALGKAGTRRAKGLTRNDRRIRHRVSGVTEKVKIVIAAWPEPRILTSICVKKPTDRCWCLEVNCRSCRESVYNRLLICRFRNATDRRSAHRALSVSSEDPAADRPCIASLNTCPPSDTKLS